MRLEILFTAWNRLEFTKLAFNLMIRNTNWSLVERLIVYDDTSEDGTAEYLITAGLDVPVPAFEFRQVNFNSPPATMNDYFSLTEADVVAKIDNDIAVPPRWLQAMYGVMERNPTLELLGMEAARTGPPVKRRPRYSWIDTSHIGGVGLMRCSAFHRRRSIPARGRFGFTEWQRHQNPVRGWITPDLRVCQLDRLPFEPYISLSDDYIAKGWQRPWPKYDDLTPWWWEWLQQESVAA